MNQGATNPSLQPTLKAIQLRLSVIAGRQLTHGDLAHIAGVKVRSIGEWMRGATSPPSGLALLRLLSALPENELRAVLEPWKSSQSAVKNMEDKGAPLGRKPKRRPVTREKSLRQRSKNNP